MSGGSPGSPGPGGTHARGFCPACYRDAPGGVDHETGRVILRRHRVKAGGDWCSDGDRLQAMTERDLALRFIQGRPVEGAPEPHPGYVDYVRKTWLGSMTPHEWLASRTAQASPTGCPACGSDDYDTEPGPDGTPDYEHGLKTCQNCGEQWQ